MLAVCFVFYMSFYLNYVCIYDYIVFALLMSLCWVCIYILFVFIVMEDSLVPRFGDKLPSHTEVDGQCYYTR